ncbi:MAG: DUF5133 domain-containing protein, partial [Streptomyces sp.]|uniref:DUF5133 domain-containing protein n=1 Tax=Streptomyces sp. TaxID=1931 RepID=UPI00345626D4|nr:DUF5133 domain-containing protein [Streptomyces sp.]
ATLRRLVDDYERLLTAEAAADQRASDLAYTLCVITGTRDIAAALAKSRHLLAAAATAGLPPVTIPATPSLPALDTAVARTAAGAALPGVPSPPPAAFAASRDSASAPLAVAE